MKKFNLYFWLLLAALITGFTSRSLSQTNCSKPAPPNTSDVNPLSIDWVWENRIKNEAINFKNLIFDQIFATGGKLNYIVRWESDEPVTAAKRDQIEVMLSRQVNNWVNVWLKGYDCWPFETINVKVVAWAVNNRSTLQWTDASWGGKVYVGLIEEGAPHGPQSCNRFYHRDGNYSGCAGGADNHFDMALWCTKGFNGGAGGDWGQRVSSTYILNNTSAQDVHILEHEIGHGFNLPDFYDANQFPPASTGGLPPAIMQAGAASHITPWDGWMLRRVYSELKSRGDRGWVFNNTNPAPSVSLTAPSNNATFTAPATIAITANASDANGSVTQVDFYNGSTLLGSDATSPYNFSWTNVAAGTYTITAKATDNGGATSTSSAVTIVVNSTNNAFSLIVNTSPSGGGTVTRSPDQATYTSGAVVTITAVPANGYSFSGWSGDATGTSSATTVTMNTNKTVTATFTPSSNSCSWTEYQMENGSWSSGTITETVNGGYTGGSYVNTNNVAGSWAQIVVNPTTTRNHNIRLRYANMSANDRAVSVSVNGATVISSLSLPSTGAWTTWVIKEFSLSLNAGSNTIRFTALTGEGNPNLDRLDVCQGGTTARIVADVQPFTCREKGAQVAAEFSLDQDPQGNVKVFQNYPNPLETYTTIGIWLKQSSKVKINLYNSIGNQVDVIADKKFDKGYHTVPYNSSRIKAGVYIYEVETGGISIRKQMVIK